MTARGVLTMVWVLAATTACTRKAQPKFKRGAACREAVHNALEVELASQGRDLRRLGPAPQAQIALVSDAMTLHCADDHWSTAAIACMAGAEDPDDVGACHELFTAAQNAGIAAAPAEAAAPGFQATVDARRDAELRTAAVTETLDDTRAQLAAVVAQFRVWKAANPTRPCPASILDLTRDLGGRVDYQDPWHTELRVRCGPPLPATVPFGVISSGPDALPDTADDVRSW